MKNYILALLLCTVGVFYAQTEGSGKYAINQLTVNSKNSDFGTAFYGEDKLVFAWNYEGRYFITSLSELNESKWYHVSAIWDA